MNDERPKFLDILRLVIALITFAGAAIIAILMFSIVYNLFADNEDGFSGLIFIFIIPLIIGSIVYFIISLQWIKKYAKTRHLSLLQRTTTQGEAIVKIVVAIFLLSYASIPLAAYWAVDLVEAVKRKRVVSMGRTINHQTAVYQSQPIEKKDYCQYCGKVVDYKYDRFCQHCGKEIDYR